jgi:NAD(P)-dependent dehydrogenase (short-subunit alcohol dehydrogenase family)
MFDLRGKRALITGASSGLGAHFAVVLVRAGAEVVLAARRQQSLDEVASLIGAQCRTVALDVTDSRSVDAAVAEVGPLDILINNAGVVRTKDALGQTESDWDLVIDTNLKGMFLVAQATARAMRERGTGGAIVNVASILGIRQAGGVAPYAVSKAGVIQMTKSLGLELARFGIRVNALAPGYVATDLNRDFFGSEAGKAMVGRIPQRRLGALEDLDGPLLLLASDASRYMTGSVVVVDGGHLLSSL